MKKLSLFPSLLIVCVLAAGCAQIPEDRDALPQRDAASAQLAGDIKLAREGWPAAQWWTRFDDPQLNALMQRALQDGPSLQVAAARIASARAALQLDGANNGNDIAFKGAANRQRYSSNGLFPAPIGGAYFSDFNAQLVATHEFDWWGKRRAQFAASLSEVSARRAEYAQAEQTLAAAVAQSYFNLHAGWARLDNLQQMRAAQSALVVERQKLIVNGLATSDEQRKAEGDLNALKRETVVIETQIAREREALRALVGADGKELADIAPRPVSVENAALPATLGIELLARRPDLQAARARVEAALSRIEVSKAAFYPDVSLTGAVGLDSLSLDKLMQYTSRTPFIGATLTLPLFNSATLQAQLGIVRDQRNELIADYNQSVINAIRDVAQAGAGLQGVEREQAEQAIATRLSQDNLRSTQARFEHGLTDTSTLRNAQLAVFEQHDQGLQLKARALLGEISLIKALGGGYRAGPTDVAQPMPPSTDP
ncbi:MAG TPA: efflux transporter outer membrane subunit [Rhodocyclaceae bacterium]|nr:efflux transporter outer membrane subunit [Rhodocyclaceae bacterium]